AAEGRPSRGAGGPARRGDRSHRSLCRGLLAPLLPAAPPPQGALPGGRASVRASPHATHVPGHGRPRRGRRRRGRGQGPATLRAMRSVRRVVFITHGGPRIGLGHVKRCLALAKALGREAAEVAFVASPDFGVAKVITSAGFDVDQRTWEGDPAAAYDALGDRDVDTVIVDAY